MAVKPWTLFFKGAPPQPGDEQEGGWPREQLIKMDARFRERPIAPSSSAATADNGGRLPLSELICLRSTANSSFVAMNIQPTITIRPGFPVRVIVNRDLLLAPYQG